MLIGTKVIADSTDEQGIIEVIVDSTDAEVLTLTSANLTDIERNPTSDEHTTEDVTVNSTV